MGSSLFSTYFCSVFTYCCFLHFGFSLFVKWNPKNHYFIFLLLAFFLIRVRKPSPLSGFLGQGLSCILSCISPKKSPFLPQNGRFCFFSYLHRFLSVRQCFLHKHRPKSADKAACIDLGNHHNAFSPINSKCDRAFVAPPEFKSLMLRQSTVQRAFLALCAVFLCKKRNL